MRKDLKALFAGLLALSLVACGGGGSSATTTTTEPSSGGTEATAAATTTSDEGKVLRIATQYSVSTLLPWKSTQDGDYYIFNNIYDSLVINSASDYLPGFAKSWTVADDQVTWDFTLREDAYWHTGNDLFGDEKVNVTAQDVADSIAFLMDEKNEAFQLENMVNAIESVEVTGDHSLRIVAKQPDALFLYYMSQVYIIPMKAIDEGYDLNAHPVGSGPYKFVSHKVDDEVVLEKNPDYSATLEPGLDKIIFKIMPDKSVAAIALQNGEVDIVPQLLSTDITAVSNDDKLVLVPASTSWYRFMAYNLDHEKFQDIKVRTAIAEAIDFDSIVAAIFANDAGVTLAIPSYGGGIPNEYYGGDTETWKKMTPFDTDAAAALMEEAGWTKGADGIYEKNGEKFAFTIKAPSSDGQRVKMCEMAATYLKQFGMDVTVQQTEFATLADDVLAGDTEVWCMGGGSGINGPQFLYYSPIAATIFRTGYVDPELDALIDTAFHTVDDAEREAMLKEVGVKAVESRIHIGGYFEYTQTGANKRVTGFDNCDLLIPLTCDYRNVSVN